MNQETKPKTLKNEIKQYEAILSEEQKSAKRIILQHENKVVVLKGKAGTSKSFLACNVALNMLEKKEIDKLYIIRPAVAIEELGFLPGDIEDKLTPYFLPILENLEKLASKEKIDKFLKEGKIKILPVAFIQGVTIDTLAIIDEAQNITVKQMKMLLTRLGEHGKYIFTGDTDQVMLDKEKDSGFEKLLELNGKLNNFTVIELLENRRSKFVKEVLELYK